MTARSVVTFVLPSFAAGGAERVTLTLLTALDRQRFAPELIVFDADGPLAEFVPRDVPLHALGRTRLRYALPALIRHLRRSAPAVIVSTLGYVNLALAAARPILPCGSRLVIREANLPSLSLQAQPHQRLFRSAYWLLYPLADRVIASSRRMANELENRFRVSHERLSVLPNPVDVEGIRQRIQNIRRAAGNGPRFVAAGSLTGQKGFDRLIATMPKLAPNVRLVILGNGPERVPLESLAERLGVARRITFAGFQSNPWEWYAGADAFIMPSRWEGMPNAALEALACGTPVIATPESGGLAEVAAVAPDGGVTVVEFGPPFIRAMHDVRSDPPHVPRPTLLPAAYHIRAVAAAFEEIIAGS
jgi:glycosyltransferase involved in cell wall biosynthesis